MPGGRGAPNADNRGRRPGDSAGGATAARVRGRQQPGPGRQRRRITTRSSAILQAAITSLGPASRDALDAALPGLRELTGAVDALADDVAGGLGPPAPDGRAATPR
jgi:hypothetical protein